MRGDMAVTSSSTELMAAIRGLSAARELPPEVILDALKAALKSAYDKIPDREASEVTVEISESSGAAHVYGHFAVTEEEFIEDPLSQMTPEQAETHKPGAAVGDLISLDVTPVDFGRIAAQTAKQVILQRIREAEREQTYLTYADREGEIVYGTVQTTNRDLITVALDRVEAIMPKSHQIPGERYMPNQRVRVYVAEVKRAMKGPQIIVSRSHKNMLLRLMELEIPEVFQGAVEVKAIAREAGNRSKVAVWSHQEGVDPVGACVGMRGVRIQSLVRELGGEKIDIVEWDPDPRMFIKHALSPARVMFVALEAADEEITHVRGTAAVIVPDDQLSLAIGREGQNARLAAKLTGWRIDIRAESESADLLENLRAEEEIRKAEQSRRAEAERKRLAEDLSLKPEGEDESAGEQADVQDVAAAMPAPAEDEPQAPAAHDGAATDLEVAEQPETASEDAPATIGAAVASDTSAADEEDSAEELEPAAVAKPVEAAPATAKTPAPATVKPAAKAAETPRPAPAPSKPAWTKPRDAEEELLVGDSGKPQRQTRRLVRDPKTGELVAEVRRKRSRRDWRDDVDKWTGEEDFDFDEDEMDFKEEDFLAGGEENDEEE